MINPVEFLRTIYLGDRACKEIRLNAWERRVEITVNVISRVRDPAGWNYHTAEDVVDGRLVFSDVESISFQPSGPLPNDYIGDFSVALVSEATPHGPWLFRLSIDSVYPDGRATEVTIAIVAGSVHIEDPSQPGTKIQD
jgi:hypothetical protein